MLSYFSKKIKYLSQQIYNDYIFSFDISIFTCSCGFTGCFVAHGYYTRSIKAPHKKIKLSIKRIKCKSCNATHAILHPSIVPYSQTVLADTISMITIYEKNESRKSILNKNPELTESDVRYILKNYKEGWKQRIKSYFPIPILDVFNLDDFLKKIVYYCKRAFMQNKCCFYRLV